MSDNPYQSPLDSGQSSPGPGEGHGLAAWIMVPVGLLMGSVTIGFFGAVGAGLLWFIGQQPEVVQVGFIGGMFGAVGGALIGAVAGLSASIAPLRPRKYFPRAVSVAAAVYGAAVGALGGAAVHFGFTIWPAIGASIGCAAGACGGFLLGRLLASLCWGHQ